MIIAIPTDEQDRFQREVVANSPHGEPSRHEQDAALQTFVEWYASAGTDTIHGAIISCWQDKQFQMAWRDDQMIFVLTQEDAS